MPSVELSVAELKYLAKMNGESIFVMQTMEKKSKTAFPDLPLAERIQAKFALVLPKGLPDLFTELRAAASPNPRLVKNPRAGAKKP